MVCESLAMDDCLVLVCLQKVDEIFYNHCTTSRYNSFFFRSTPSAAKDKIDGGIHLANSSDILQLEADAIVMAHGR